MNGIEVHVEKEATIVTLDGKPAYKFELGPDDTVGIRPIGLQMTTRKVDPHAIVMALNALGFCPDDGLRAGMKPPSPDDPPFPPFETEPPSRDER